MGSFDLIDVLGKEESIRLIEKFFKENEKAIQENMKEEFFLQRVRPGAGYEGCIGNRTVKVEPIDG